MKADTISHLKTLVTDTNSSTREASKEVLKGLIGNAGLNIIFRELLI